MTSAAPAAIAQQTALEPALAIREQAVLAALAIADELHRVREERGEREEILKEQAERCLNLVERALRKTE